MKCTIIGNITLHSPPAKFKSVQMAIIFMHIGFTLKVDQGSNLPNPAEKDVRHKKQETNKQTEVRCYQKEHL